MELDVGMEVMSEDYAVREITGLVVDPRSWTLTHVVVEPHRRHDEARLVPVDAFAPAGDRVRLTLSLDELEAAPRVVATDFVELPTGEDAAEEQQRRNALTWPFFPLAGDVSGFGAGYGGVPGSTAGGADRRFVATRIERIPGEELELRRSTDVVSSDDHVVGRLDGFVVAPGGGITHLVLASGHLWGEHDVAIPVDAVGTANWDRIHLVLPRDEIRDLPTVPFSRPRGAVR